MFERNQKYFLENPVNHKVHRIWNFEEIFLILLEKNIEKIKIFKIKFIFYLLSLLNLIVSNFQLPTPNSVLLCPLFVLDPLDFPQFGPKSRFTGPAFIYKYIYIPIRDPKFSKISKLYIKTLKNLVILYIYTDFSAKIFGFAENYIYTDLYI